MNAEDRERFFATLCRDDDFRADVRRELLTEDLLNLPQMVAAPVDAVAQKRQDFTAMTQSVAGYMERTISPIGEGFGAVRADLGDMRAQMGTGFNSVKAKFDQVDADLQNIRDQLAS